MATRVKVYEETECRSHCLQDDEGGLVRAVLRSLHDEASTMDRFLEIRKKKAAERHEEERVRLEEVRGTWSDRMKDVRNKQKNVESRQQKD